MENKKSGFEFNICEKDSIITIKEKIGTSIHTQYLNTKEKAIIDYLWDPSRKLDRKVWWLAFKFTLVDGKLYRRTMDDLLLKCLDSD